MCTLCSHIHIQVGLCREVCSNKNDLFSSIYVNIEWKIAHHRTDESVVNLTLILSNSIISENFEFHLNENLILNLPFLIDVFEAGWVLFQAKEKNKISLYILYIHRYLDLSFRSRIDLTSQIEKSMKKIIISSKMSRS